MLGAVLQTDGLDDLIEPRLSGGRAGEIHGERDVLHGRERRHEVERLEDEADPISPQQGQSLLAERREVGVADQDRSAGDRVEASEAVHQGGLP